MVAEFNEPNRTVHAAAADRIGFAKLTRMAFDGADLHPLWQSLMARVADGTAEAGVALDLSLIAQLLGEKQTGLLIQAEALAFHRLYRSPCRARSRGCACWRSPRRSTWAATCRSSSCWRSPGSSCRRFTSSPDAGLPSPLPDHDVAIVIASDSDECRDALDIIDRAAARWPRPMLNSPRLVCNLDRDKLHRLLSGIEGLDIPATMSVTRAQLSDVARSDSSFADIATELQFPVIVRPRGSHAGVGLAKLEMAPRSPDILRNGRSRNSSFRVSSTIPAKTACFASIVWSSSTAGPTPATWRSPIDGKSGISTPE